jgi:hypothetical protein
MIGMCNMQDDDKYSIQTLVEKKLDDLRVDDS